MSQANLLNQMRIVMCGPGLDEFDPTDSVLYWLKSSKGSRHLTHKPKSKRSDEPSGSAENLESEQPDTQLLNEVMEKLGDTDTRVKLKEALAKDQCSLQ